MPPISSLRPRIAVTYLVSYSSFTQEVVILGGLLFKLMLSVCKSGLEDTVLFGARHPLLSTRKTV